MNLAELKSRINKVISNKNCTKIADNDCYKLEVYLSNSKIIQIVVCSDIESLSITLLDPKEKHTPIGYEASTNIFDSTIEYTRFTKDGKKVKRIKILESEFDTKCDSLLKLANIV